MFLSAKVYRARDIQTELHVAVKVEPMDGTHTYLDREALVYERLGVEESPGIPKRIWYGQESGYRVLVLELLGDNVQTVFAKFRVHFIPALVAGMAIQMVTAFAATTIFATLTYCFQIERLKYVHSQGLIHCDIKPSNFTFTIKEDRKVDIHLIDFAFAREWRIQEQNREVFEGTLYFASINATRGQSE